MSEHGYEHATAERMRFFAEHLLDWYRVHKRDLPWRRTSDPYRIWVSEVMLQQTRVETVIPYYHRFLERFPTLVDLADAPEEDVLKLWEGLGYYSRARNLQAAAREVKTKYSGIVPDDPDAVGSLPGVGPYTKGAILSIAFNRPEPAVDGNVMRVLSRFFLIREDIAKPSTRTGMERLARELIPEGRAGDFNQALMELGATVCTPKAPYCLTCPVMERCVGRIEGEEEALPVKTKAKAPRPERRAVAWVMGAGAREGCFLIRQRPERGLLAKMWELPHVRLNGTEAASAEPVDATGAASAGSSAAKTGPSARQLGVAESAAGYQAGGEAANMRTDVPPSGHSQTHGEHAARVRALADGLAAEADLRVVPLGYAMSAEYVFSHLHWHLDVYLCRLADGPVGVEDKLPSGYRWIRPEDMGEYAFPNVFLRIIREMTKA